MTELPTPDPQSLLHSKRVDAHLRELLQARSGFLSFAEFMQECLYAPSLGYYVAGSRKFGEDGDFVTAPELTSIFGRVIANQIAPLEQELETFDILELGAGTGRLALHVLTRLAELEALPERYYILEASADLRERQQRLLRDADSTICARVEWLERIPASFDGVILANEVLDALPVERFVVHGEQLMQLGVAVDGERLIECERAAPTGLSAAVAEIEADLGRRLPDGFRSEVCLAAAPWVQQLATSLQRGLILFIDYGVDRETYYRDDRQDGWLRCHFRHHAHNDPLLYPGIQDLTAWVDFSGVAAAGVAAGAQVAGYVNQANFLLSAGLEDELAGMQELPERERLGVSRALRMLMMPGEMGENFKCLGLTKNVTIPAALRMMDRTHTL